MARPTKPVDGEQVRKLASIGCTTADIGYVLGCSADTLERRFAAALEKGRAEGRASLRRKQWELAMEGNGTMLVWLGKNLLGQKDRADVTSGGAPFDSPSPMRIFEWPSNGRNPGETDNGRGTRTPPRDPPRASRETPPVAARPAARANGNGRALPPGAYRWPDGRVRSEPPPED